MHWRLLIGALFSGAVIGGGAVYFVVGQDESTTFDSSIRQKMYYGSPADSKNATAKAVNVNSEAWEVALNAFAEIGVSKRKPIPPKNRAVMLDVIAQHPALNDALPTVALAAFQASDVTVRRRALSLIENFQKKSWAATIEIIRNTASQESNEQLKARKNRFLEAASK